MLQGAYFTEVDLSNIALEIDRKEKELMAAMGTETPEFLKFMAEDSGNVHLDGNFSIQVIRTALEIMSLSVLPVGSEHAADVQANPTREMAFICNQSEHWFSIRKLAGKFYNLNSLNKAGPELISDFYLSAYLAQLQTDGWSIFVVRGAFPTVNAALGGRGKWFDAAAVGQGGGRGRAAPARREEDEDVMMEQALAASLLDAPQAASMEVDDDEELQAAIAMSLSEAPQPSVTLPALPPPPPDHDPSSFLVQVNTPTGQKLKRRFAADATFADVCRFAVQEDEALQDLRFFLRTQHPPKRFEREQLLAGAGLGQRLNLFIEFERAAGSS